MTAEPVRPLLLVQMRMALICIVIAVLGGLLAALHYIPELSPQLHDSGLGLTKLRPLHTTFASVWIYGAAIAVIYHFLAHQGSGLQRGDVRRFWFHTVCWITAGIGIVGTLFAGVFTGREYLGFHPAFSVLLLAGWLALAWSFLRRALPGFWGKPVYIYFWTVGILYFLYTFVEGHAYLLPWVQDRPVRDIALHWKACGTLVGSFNFLVYGCLLYVSERLSGCPRYAQSTLAFSLFAVGCLNSFTNFAHHTYHLPQSHAVKWIAFVVSMTEAVILLRLLYDTVCMLRQRSSGTEFEPVVGYLSSAKIWTTVMLTTSILISVPTLNSFIHGTHVVTGHAMGAELGIDSMVLFGCVAFLLREVHPGATHVRAILGGGVMRGHLAVLNLSMAALVLWLTVAGLAHGIYRYRGLASPEWVGLGAVVFPLAGSVLAGALLFLVWRWLPLLTRPRTQEGALESDAAATQGAARAIR
ncbi:MAG: cbb3-type cytochrome c oxidase subunit I [Planctomycetota bacterium]